MFWRASFLNQRIIIIKKGNYLLLRRRAVRGILLLPLNGRKLRTSKLLLPLIFSTSGNQSRFYYGPTNIHRLSAFWPDDKNLLLLREKTDCLWAALYVVQLKQMQFNGLSSCLHNFLVSKWIIIKLSYWFIINNYCLVELFNLFFKKMNTLRF